MDHKHFLGQINRLAAAYRVEIPATTMAAYWTVFSGSDDALFAAACEKALASERAFPPPAALKEIMRTRHEIDRRAPASDLPHLNAPPIRPEDLDVLRYAHRAVHRVGSPGHAGFLANSAALIEIVGRIYAARSAEAEAHPADRDLARRAAVLGKTLSRQYEWHDHFERTGESLREQPPRPGMEGGQRAGAVSVFTNEPPPAGFSRADGAVPTMGGERRRRGKGGRREH